MNEYKGAAVERQEITAIAEPVVAALGTGWSVVQPNPDNRGVYLVNGQERLWMARGWDTKSKGRIVFHGDYPGENTYRLDAHEITVAESHSPDVIARHIERRLLPKYRETLAEHLAQLDRAAKAQAAREALAARIMEAAGPIARLTTPRHDKMDTGVSINTSAPNGWGNFKIMHHGDTVAIELHSVPADVAVEIARVIKR